MNKRQKKKHSVLRVRRTNKTERGRLHTMVIADKKKEANKKKCRGKMKEDKNVG